MGKIKRAGNHRLMYFKSDRVKHKRGKIKVRTDLRDLRKDFERVKSGLLSGFSLLVQKGTQNLTKDTK